MNILLTFGCVAHTITVICIHSDDYDHGDGGGDYIIFFFLPPFDSAHNFHMCSVFEQLM